MGGLTTPPGAMAPAVDSRLCQARQAEQRSKIVGIVAGSLIETCLIEEFQNRHCAQQPRWAMRRQASGGRWRRPFIFTCHSCVHVLCSDTSYVNSCIPLKK